MYACDLLLLCPVVTCPALPCPPPSLVMLLPQLVLFGPRVAVALPDCRSQRTEDQVLSVDTHMSLIIKIEVRGAQP